MTSWTRHRPEHAFQVTGLHAAGTRPHGLHDWEGPTIMHLGHSHYADELDPADPRNAGAPDRPDPAPSYLLRELERIVDHGLATDGEAEAYLFRLGMVLELPSGRLTLTAAGYAARRDDR